MDTKELSINQEHNPNEFWEMGTAIKKFKKEYPMAYAVFYKQFLSRYSSDESKYKQEQFVDLFVLQIKADEIKNKEGH